MSPKGTIQQWSTYRGPFEAPELGPRIQGVLGDKHITTSRIRRTEGRIVHTESGSIYELGEPDELFVQWLAENDYQFDPNNPIKVVKKITQLPEPKAQSILRATPLKGTEQGE